MIHELKILPQYFEAVQAGLKNFEIRQNDRGFKEGDTLILKEWEFDFPIVNNKFNGGEYTGREMTKEISYILKGGQYGIEKGHCIASLKQEGIILRNIDLTGISKKEQLKKTKEELKELTDALIEDEFYSNVEDKDKQEIKNHIIEEFWDVVQSHLGLLEKYGIKADEVMRGYDKHIEKLKFRPRKKE